MASAASTSIEIMVTRIDYLVRIHVSTVSLCYFQSDCWAMTNRMTELDLPEYESYEALRQQVYTAMTAGSEYFGFA